MTLPLPPEVASHLEHLAQTLSATEYAELARRLTLEVGRRRRAKAEREFIHDSPGKLAVTIGQDQRPHLELLDRFLIRAAKGDAVRAAVAMSPRVGKTERLLKVGSAWRLDRDPDCRVMMISGGKGLVTQSSRWVRDELERPEAGYRNRPRRDVRAVDDWKIEAHEGGIFVGSLGSRIIGRGANLLLVDDLLGKPEEAESETMRNKAYSFLTSSFGRLEPGASVIIVNSRWHIDDPIGRLLKEQPGVWEYLNVPAIAETHGFNEKQPDLCLCGDPWLGAHADPIGRVPGEALWPERFDAIALEASRLLIGSHYFSAQFQGRPRKREGGLWREDWITDRRAPALTVQQILATLRPRIVSVDPSASDDDKGDEAGIVCGGKNPLTGDAHVTHDLSGTMTPEGWARTAIVAAIELEADVVYEKNLTPAFMRRAFKTAWEGLQAEAAKAASSGEGYKVDPVIGTAPVTLPPLLPSLHPVSAKVGKELRAGPVAQRYEQKRVVHNGVFLLLEEQQLTWKPTDNDSPDRLDAVVHLVAYLGDGGSDVAIVETVGATVPTGAATAASLRGR